MCCYTICHLNAFDKYFTTWMYLFLCSPLLFTWKPPQPKLELMCDLQIYLLPLQPCKVIKAKYWGNGLTALAGGKSCAFNFSFVLKELKNTRGGTNHSIQIRFLRFLWVFFKHSVLLLFCYRNIALKHILARKPALMCCLPIQTHSQHRYTRILWKPKE